MSRFFPILILFLFLPGFVSADSRVAEVQRRLNNIQIDAGPVDGGWGPKTEAAVKQFLEYRGIEYDGTFSDNEYREIIGQKSVKFPSSGGISSWQIVGDKGFPSQDTYRRNPNDPSHFILTLRANDFDPAKAPADDKYAAFKHYNLKKQRAEIGSGRIIRFGQVYTLDFEVKVSNPTAGSIMQVHAGGSQGAVNITSYPDSIRLVAGRDINNVAVFRGDWIGDWVKVRLVFRVDRADRSFFRFYINGVETFDSLGMATDFGFSRKGASLAFGSYRGKSSTEVTVEYRNISLMRGDAGNP